MFVKESGSKVRIADEGAESVPRTKLSVEFLQTAVKTNTQVYSIVLSTSLRPKPVHRAAGVPHIY